MTWKTMRFQDSQSLGDDKQKKILITGGAGYIGSLLTGYLLHQGYGVTVIDNLSFGGESLLGYWRLPNFQFVRGDICDSSMFKTVKHQLQIGDLAPEDYSAIVHLAAIVGFPASRIAGAGRVTQVNVGSTVKLFDMAAECGVERFVFASTYSNYGMSKDGGPVTEESPLTPQSLYAETKISAEQYLLGSQHIGDCVPVVLRFATLFGLSPRMRFDLMVNQFVLEAITRGNIKVYQPDYMRSFVHVADVARCIRVVLEAPKTTIGGQIFNVGGERGNYTKRHLLELIKELIPGLKIEYVENEFPEDMRNISVSFAKIQKTLRFIPAVTVENGIAEIRDAIQQNLIQNPTDMRYRNAPLIFQ